MLSRPVDGLHLLARGAAPLRTFFGHVVRTPAEILLPRERLAAAAR